MAARDVGERHFEALLDIGDDVGAKLVAVLLVALAMRTREVAGAMIAKASSASAMSGIGRSHDLKTDMQEVDALLESGANAFVERHEAEIRETATRNPERSIGESVGLEGSTRAGERVAAVLGNLCLQEQQRCPRGAAHRPLHRDRRPAERPPLAGDEAGRGAEATMPQNAPGWRSEPPCREPVQIGSIEVASATARAADEPPQMRWDRRGCRSRHRRVLGVGAGAHSGTLVLPTDDGAGLAHRGDHALVPGGHVVGKERRSPVRAQPAVVR